MGCTTTKAKSLSPQNSIKNRKVSEGAMSLPGGENAGGEHMSPQLIPRYNSLSKQALITDNDFHHLSPINLKHIKRQDQPSEASTINTFKKIAFNLPEPIREPQNRTNRDKMLFRSKTSITSDVQDHIIYVPIAANRALPQELIKISVQDNEQQAAENCKKENALLSFGLTKCAEDKVDNVNNAEGTHDIHMVENFKCKICLTNYIEVVLLPCGHVCCYECSQRLDIRKPKCPFDREDVIEMKKMTYS